MENTSIKQYKIYVENSKSGEKTTAVVTRQPEKKNIHYVENYYNHTLINFLSPKPQIHNLEKYPLTKQTHNTQIEEQNAPSI